MFNQFNQEIGNPVPEWTPRILPGIKELIGNFCVLQPLNIEEHGLDLFSAFKSSDNDIYTYVPFGPFDDYALFISWLSGNILNKVFYAIIDHKTKKSQGIAGYWSYDLANGVIEVGSILYSKALQNTPAGTEAMYLMAREIFNLGYRRYEWKCNALNMGSRNAAIRLGFSFEGIFRQHSVIKGYNRDTAWFSILDHEWPSIKTRLEKWLSLMNFDSNGRQIVSLKDI